MPGPARAGATIERGRHGLAGRTVGRWALRLFLHRPRLRWAQRKLCGRRDRESLERLRRNKTGRRESRSQEPAAYRHPHVVERRRHAGWRPRLQRAIAPRLARRPETDVVHRRISLPDARQRHRPRRLGVDRARRDRPFSRGRERTAVPMGHRPADCGALSRIASGDGGRLLARLERRTASAGHVAPLRQSPGDSLLSPAPPERVAGGASWRILLMGNNTVSSSYRGRLAPSPTGYLHLGHARTFWIAQQRAQANRGGALVL